MDVPLFLRKGKRKEGREEGRKERRKEEKEKRKKSFPLSPGQQGQETKRVR